MYRNLGLKDSVSIVTMLNINSQKFKVILFFFTVIIINNNCIKKKNTVTSDILFIFRVNVILILTKTF